MMLSKFQVNFISTAGQYKLLTDKTILYDNLRKFKKITRRRQRKYQLYFSAAGVSVYRKTYRLET